MGTLSKIGKKILKNNRERVDTPDSTGSFFQNPVSGDLNYHTFSDYSSESELAVVLEQYLNEYGLSQSDYLEMAQLAFKLHEQKNKGGETGDLSEFVYIMH